jgi:hypothetical protein
MYRENDDELAKRRIAALAAELIASGTEALERPYGGSAYRAVESGIARLQQLLGDAHLSNNTMEAEALCRVLERDTAVLHEMCLRSARCAERFRALGMPPKASTLFDPNDAEILSRSFAFVQESAREWFSHVPPEDALVCVSAEGTSFFFLYEGLPFHLELTVESEGSVTWVASTLRGTAPKTEKPILIRPQSFGDDLMTTLTGNTDLTFDHEEFDTRYFVSGSPDALRWVLTPRARQCLLFAGRDRLVTLRVENAIARKVVRTPEALKESCELMAALGKE